MAPNPQNPRELPVAALASDSGRQPATIDFDRAALIRLDEVLTGALRHAGHGRISRREILGALVAAAPEDPDALYQLLRSYRQATVGELTGGTGDVVELIPRRRGRPRSSGL
jgi:hypothetical protein